MFVSTLSKSPKSCGKVSSSYAEISRFIRLAALQNSLRDIKNPRLFQSSPVSGEDRNGQKTEPTCFSAFKNSLSFSAATHKIKDLDATPLLQEDIVLHGYLGARRDASKNLSFATLLNENLDYSVQIVSKAHPEMRDTNIAHDKLKSLEIHTPVAVRGRLKECARPDPGYVSYVKTKEITLGSIQSLNKFSADIIFTPDTVFPPQSRHLQIRSDNKIRDALVFRSKAAAICRHVLGDIQDFTEIETPLLFKSTPEGAKEFIVPTRRKGLAFALPQSPQQFKQLLMASGISKYYQIARCFRDEDLRADRQPEFTQLDLEMAFATGKEVMACMESLISRLWQDMLSISLPSPFPTMTYEQAMSTYGSDKPDTRLDTDISPISRIEHLLPADLISKISPLTKPIVEIMRLRLSDPSPNQTRVFIGNFLSSPDALPFNENPSGGPGIFIYDSRQPLSGLQPFGFEAAEEVERRFDAISPDGILDGDLLILQARPSISLSGGSTPIGNLRLALHKAAVAKRLLALPLAFHPLWITDFPLFSPTVSDEPGQGGATGLAATHHPFTAPKMAADVDLLLTDPTKAIGEHYDLVLNGVELGGGSRRIHHAEMQRFVMEEVLKMTPERVAEFGHLLEALRAGCPPHAGMALGFDRLCAVMLGRESVRDVIAFPKSGKGEDVCVGAPGGLGEEVLRRYHLSVREGEE